MSHVTRTQEFRQMSHVTHLNESCHTYEWDMPHIWLGHITHTQEFRQMWMGESKRATRLNFSKVCSRAISNSSSAPEPFLLLKMAREQTFEKMAREQTFVPERFLTVAAHGNTLLHGAAHCSTLEHTANSCHVLQHTATLQRTATYCNALQHFASHGITRQYTAPRCNSLQHPATHCNRL